MSMINSTAEEFVRNLAFKGLDSYEIDREIDKLKVDDSTKKEYKKIVNTYVIQYQKTDQARAWLLSVMVWAAIVTCIGLIVAVYSYYTGGDIYVKVLAGMLSAIITFGLASRARKKIQDKNDALFRKSKIRRKKFRRH